MKCRHCNGELGLSLLLCDTCAHKAMQVIHTNPRERIQIYKVIEEVAVNPVTKMIARQLMEMDVEEVEKETQDPTDRMFNERG